MECEICGEGMTLDEYIAEAFTKLKEHNENADIRNKNNI